MAENQVLEIEQIRRAHRNARPKPEVNPAFANTHRNLGVALEHIDWLKQQLEQLAHFNPDWDRLKATEDSLREHMQKLAAAYERIEGYQFTIEQYKKELEHLESALASTHIHHKMRIPGCPECDNAYL